MEFYSIKELKNQLADKLRQLGVSDKFNNSPAYKSILDRIDGLISEMNIGARMESIQVEQDAGQITFRCADKDQNGNNLESHSMTISCSDPNSISCVKTTDKRPSYDKDRKIIKEKNVIEQAAHINENGEIILNTNGAIVNNIGCDQGSCNISPWAEQAEFNKNGIMKRFESKSLSTFEMNTDVERLKDNVALYNARETFGVNKHDKCPSSTILMREKMDTARLIHEDSVKGIKYDSTIKLSQQYGLREMVMQGGNPYEPEVKIPPLSTSEIEAIIQKETDPRVIEGLRALAQDRELYAYDSASDPSFVCSGISQEGLTQSRTR